MLIKNQRNNGATHITNPETGLALATMPADDMFGEVVMREMDLDKTGPQLLGITSALADNELWNVSQQHYKDYRAMGDDPTIAFARMLCVAPLVTAGWSYEAKDNAPEGAKEFIEEVLEPFRVDTMKNAMEGYIDFGWCPFEIVYEPRDDGFIVVENIKALLQDYTTILVNRNDGDWLGFRQYIYKPDNPGPRVDVFMPYALLVVLDYEGTDWYGRALLENVRSTWEQSKLVNSSATRFDEKIAGAHWLVHYPIGKSPVAGVETDNAVIADRMLMAMRSSGGYAVPRKIAQFADEMNGGASKAEDVWKVEILAAPTTTASFDERLKYFDVLKIRGFGIPERAVLEGQFGTKAESEAQADFAITNFEMRHIIITEWINYCVTNPLLEMNYGPEAKDSVKVNPTPLTDSKKSFWQTLYSQLLFSPEVMPVELPNIDLAAMRKQIGLPETKNVNSDNDQQMLADVFNQKHADNMVPAGQETAAPTQETDAQQSDWFQ